MIQLLQWCLFSYRPIVYSDKYVSSWKSNTRVHLSGFRKDNVSSLTVHLLLCHNDHNLPVFLFARDSQIFNKELYFKKGFKRASTSLPGIELIFFIVVGTMLTFGFVTQRVLKTHQCFSYCWEVHTQLQGLLSNASPVARRLGRHKKLGGDRRQLTPSEQWDIPDHTTPCSK